MSRRGSIRTVGNLSIFVFVVSLGVASDIHSPHAAEKLEEVGQTPIWGGKIRVYSTRLNFQGATVQADNILKLMPHGDKTQICQAYIYRGPMDLWEQFKGQYSKMVVYVLDEDAPKQRKGRRISADAMPGYPLIPGVKMGKEQLETMPMSCLLSDMPWQDEFSSGSAPSFRISPDDGS